MSVGGFVVKDFTLSESGRTWTFPWASLLGVSCLRQPPLKSCSPDKRMKSQLADEHAQRLMIKAIGRSMPSHISGLRCWGAFCDAMGVHVHFPASSQMAIRYVGMFGSFATIQQYLKHLRWAHRFLHLDNYWETPSVKQCIGGLKKSSTPKRERCFLLSRDVLRIIKVAAKHDDIHTAALIALSRVFLLRVPSEGIPLQWDGEHSKVEVTGTRALITLTRRKNREYHSVLERSCCCQSSSPDLFMSCVVPFFSRLTPCVSIVLL